MVSWKKYYKNIPAQVKIGKNFYEVLWTHDFPNDEKQLGESRFHNEKQIIINLNQPIKEAVHTYWHEVLHILSYEFDADLTETQVKALEKGLYYILKSDNLFKKEVKNATNKRKRRNTKRVCKAGKKTR